MSSMKEPTMDTLNLDTIGIMTQVLLVVVVLLGFVRILEDWRSSRQERNVRLEELRILVAIGTVRRVR